jgi:hypothetical protein
MIRHQCQSELAANVCRAVEYDLGAVLRNVGDQALAIRGSAVSRDPRGLIVPLPSGFALLPKLLSFGGHRIIRKRQPVYRNLGDREADSVKSDLADYLKIYRLLGCSIGGKTFGASSWASAK